MFNRTVKILSTLLVLASASAHAGGTVGESAPDFVLRSLADGNQRLSEHHGQVVVMTFWSPGCLPCRDAIQMNKRLNAEYAPNAIVSLAIAVTPKRDFPEQFAANQQVPFPMLLDEQGTVGELYGLRTSTKTVVVDQEGTIIFAAEGFADEHADNIRDLFGELLGWQAPEQQ